jgi:hypothetical protein
MRTRGGRLGGHGGVTVSIAIPMSAVEVAVIVVMPGFFAVTRPAEDTVAVKVSKVCQSACAVMSRVTPLVQVKVAVSCRVIPAGTMGVAGVTVTIIGLHTVLASSSGPLGPSQAASRTIAMNRARLTKREYRVRLPHRDLRL